MSDEPGEVGMRVGIQCAVAQKPQYAVCLSPKPNGKPVKILSKVVTWSNLRFNDH